MKIAVFYPRSLYTSWNLADGIVAVLNRMGHQADGFHVPNNDQVSPTQAQEIVERLPRPHALNQYDLIIVSGPEHIGPWLNHVYAETWNALQTPRAAWYHESFFREDATLDFDEINKACRCDEHFFPAVQDADFFDQEHFGFKGHCHWLPFGVDTVVFKPVIPDGNVEGWAVERYALTFIGSIDLKRSNFIGRLMKHQAPPLRTGICVQQDLDGVDMLASAMLYVQAIRRSKIVLSLPSFSKLLTPRAYEVMACGSMLAQYALDDVAAKNELPFIDSEYFQYRVAHLGYLAQRLREMLENDSEREAIARKGMTCVYELHRLEFRLETLIFRTARVPVSEAVSA